VQYSRVIASRRRHNLPIAGQKPAKSPFGPATPARRDRGTKGDWVKLTRYRTKVVIDPTGAKQSRGIGIAPLGFYAGQSLVNGTPGL
jgi:hypothetical protein